jgi:hypothetical protein
VRGAPARHNEAGIAMVTAMMVMLLVAIMIALIGASVANSVDTTKARTARVVGMVPIDNGINAYQAGLQTGVVDEATDYILTTGELEKLRDKAAIDTIVADNDNTINSDYRAVDGVWQGATFIGTFPLDAQVSIRQKLDDDNLYGYWQVYRIDLPSGDTPTGNLIVYFRGWVDNPQGSAPTHARTVRIEFRPGRFGDYQMITDGPLTLANNIDIDGPVHSNGMPESVLDLAKPAGVPGNATVWNSGAITCAPGAIATSASGPATISLPNECARGTGSYISFLRAQETFDRIRDHCDDSAGDTIYCFPAINGVYDVRMNGATVDVNGRSYPVGRFTALLFDDDIDLRGYSDGRVTIAAERGDTRAAAANIRLVGDIGNRLIGGVALPSTTLGVIAEGNIEVDVLSGGSGSKVCPVDRIEAALVAMSGGLWISPDLITSTKQYSGAAPVCTNPVLVSASIASHRPIVMRQQYSRSTEYAGYTSRRYVWNTRFRKNPPPYFPMTDQWQIAAWRDANADCLTTRRGDPTCV